MLDLIDPVFTSVVVCFQWFTCFHLFNDSFAISVMRLRFASASYSDVGLIAALVTFVLAMFNVVLLLAVSLLDH